MAINPKLIEEAKKEIAKGYTHYSYFFDNLESPKWIEPLYKEGFFQAPPLPRKEGDYIHFPSWPELNYLVKMASAEPTLIYKIITEFIDTKNIRVQEGIIDVAIDMPGEYAEKIALAAKQWIKSEYHTLIPEKIAYLVVHLIDEERINEGFNLASFLFELKKTSESARVMPQYDKWFYEKVLDICLPSLIDADYQRAISFICQLLYSSIELSYNNTHDLKNEDFSHHWRSKIEGTKDDYEVIRNLLVDKVRDVSIEIIEKGIGKPESVLAIIEQYDFPIFIRISLYIRQICTQVDIRDTEKMVIESALINDETLHHELYHLLKNHFQHFSPETKKAYLSIISQGPDDKQDVNEYEINKWKFQKLHSINNHLDKQWKKEYNKIKEFIGETSHPDFTTYQSEVWVGPTSPKNSEEIESMNIEELILYLNTWIPPNAPMADSSEGLARELRKTVVSNPNKYALGAHKFKVISSRYVSAIIGGFKDAVKDNKEITWHEIINLCMWVVKQPRSIQETDWKWSRKEIAGLLSNGFDECNSEIPYAYQADIWNILFPITEDPNPTSDYEKKFNDSYRDFLNLSINTTRGEAIHTLVKYGLWRKRHLEKKLRNEKKVKLTDMLEVKKTLENHLDIEKDNSLAIRSVYGRWFPWLSLLDKEWAISNVSTIFPSGGYSEYRNAAWSAYIRYCHPYEEIFDILKSEYNYEIEQLGKNSKSSYELNENDKKFAQHIILLHLRGKALLGNLLDKFYESAPDELCGHVNWFIFRALQDNDDISGDVIDKIKLLWENRLKQIRQNSLKHIVELSSFAWLFRSGFDDKWAIMQLKEVLIITDSELDIRERLVVEKLAELSSSMPFEAIECLELIVREANGPFSVLGWEDNAEVILKNAINSEDKKTKEIGVNIAHNLGSKGRLKFRKLLNS